ncbi:MAG TPA: SpoIIE family protein phosphatase, partial [Spirochaetota bacterium]|nr:SpoIIE family protein phosphatase [Spirochaetota bacterium]
YSALSVLFNIFQMIIYGENLSSLHLSITDAHSLVEKVNQNSVLPYIEILESFTSVLNNETIYSEEELTEMFKSHVYHKQPHNNPMFTLFTNLLLSVLFFFFGYKKAAKRRITSMSEAFYSIKYSFIYNDFVFFKSLILAGSLELSDRAEYKKTCLYLEKAIERYRSVICGGKGSSVVRLYLLQAELLRIRGKNLKAEFMYDRAIKNLDIEYNAMAGAIANEITASFFFSGGRHVIARAYIQDAFYNYQRWGAMSKVRKMERDFPEFINLHTASSLITKNGEVIANGSDEIDLGAVIKASHLITGEIYYETLITRLMNIIMEHSGAVRGCLILSEGGALSIEAESRVSNSIDTALKSEIIRENTTSVPVSITNYVSRKRKAVILDDALTTPLFSSDIYIISNACRSILCLPIVHRENFAGLLYLENNLAQGVFSSSRVRLLELVCAQAAISIQNSKYYNELKDYSQLLETRVQSRTRELEQVNENLMDINRLLRDARIEAERDMAMASNVQLSFMPTDYKDKSSWDIAFSYKPMSAVSGDFYDFYEKDGVLHGAGVFDVSGHGISSGLITVIARSIISRIFCENLNLSLKTVIQMINSMLIQEIGHTNNYLTGVLLRLKKNSIEYVNAAHPNIIKYDCRKCRAFELRKEDETWRGGFLGVAAMKLPFGEMNVPMNKGDLVVLFSDGVTEGGTNRSGEFGYEGIIKALEGGIMGSAHDVLDEINKRFFKISGDTGLRDDYTVVVIRKK